MDDIKDTNVVDVANTEGEEKTYTDAEIFETSVREEVATEKKSTNVLKEIFEWAQSIAIAMVLALIINQFFFAMVQVEGSSMLPTLESKERLVITKLFYTPKVKDIVVVKSEELQKYIIKRVIAVPGDVVDYDAQTHQITINGAAIDEPYILEDAYVGGTIAYPVTVPEGHVFVMGDNRNNSNDSRNLGMISYDDVVGRAALRITPFSKFGGLYDNLEE
ncbi:MAG: signal peptidase I [Ruminococcaceae bacterium]|nr:signal peptidase I [Oscillospiraceae bacterium]